MVYASINSSDKALSREEGPKTLRAVTFFFEFSIFAFSKSATGREQPANSREKHFPAYTMIITVLRTLVTSRISTRST